jgi:CubicO group peptidase (beta-lactamase class C family)
MKKLLLRFFGTIFLILCLFCAFLLLSGRGYLFKAAWYYTADIDDYKIFDNRVVTAGNPQPWTKSGNYNSISLPGELEQKLNVNKTVALAVIRNDSLYFERYWSGYSDSSLSGSFSVAKSINSLLIGCLMKEGKIRSLDQPVGDFVPEFNEGEKKKVTIRHLLTMSSGSNWDESYSDPFSVTTEGYYGKRVYKTATGVKIKHEPGTLHSYKSGDTQLLGFIIEKASGKSVSEYASEKLWKPLGAMRNALWSLDHKNGHEKSYCCFNSNVLDFARIGQLMIDSGRWKGTEIIDMNYWKESITPCMITDDSGLKCNYYGYQWWILPDRPEIYYARGILGQFIVMIPSKNMVVVRLGEISGGSSGNAADMVYWLVDWAESIK